MSPSRGRVSDLAKQFDAAAEPIYVLDSQRRLVFLNAACRAWIGDGEDWLGQECRYHSEVDDRGSVPVTALLCPSPEVFGGSRLTTSITMHSEAGEPDQRRVEFIPLVGDAAQVVGVIAIVGRERQMAVEGRSASDEEPSTADLHASLQRHRSLQKERFQFDRWIGESPIIGRVRSQLLLAAGSRVNVLLVGPVGSGRQHAARLIHYGRSLSSLGALVPLACGLLDAELLQGTIRGLAKRRPESESAPPGTLMLTDVDQMPPEAQAELLGFLQIAELPFRLICTARQPLVEFATQRAFRQDLAYLLSTLTIELPSLVEHLADLPLLAQYFVEESNRRGTKQLSGCTPEALDSLATYAWPGEVRELAAIVAEAHAQAPGPEITVRDLPPRIYLAGDATRHARRPEQTIVLETFLKEIEKELIERALARAKGNKTRAARLLGMTRPRLYRRLVQLGLEDAAPL
jgi:DNA-binding NtrC family response regulator